MGLSASGLLLKGNFREQWVRELDVLNLEVYCQANQSFKALYHILFPRAHEINEEQQGDEGLFGRSAWVAFTVVMS